MAKHRNNKRQPDDHQRRDRTVTYVARGQFVAYTPNPRPRTQTRNIKSHPCTKGSSSSTSARRTSWLGPLLSLVLCSCLMLALFAWRSSRDSGGSLIRPGGNDTDIVPDDCRGDIAWPSADATSASSLRTSHTFGKKSAAQNTSVIIPPAPIHLAVVNASETSAADPKDHVIGQTPRLPSAEECTSNRTHSVDISTAIRARRKAAGEMYVRSIWKTYLATPVRATDLVVYRTPAFGLPWPAPRATPLGFWECLAIWSSPTVVAVCKIIFDLLGERTAAEDGLFRPIYQRPLSCNQNRAKCQHLLSSDQEPDRPVRYVKVKLPQVSNIDAIRSRYPDRLPAASRHLTPVSAVTDDDSASEQGDEQPQPRKKQRGKRGKGRQYPTSTQPDPTERFDENDPGMTVTIWPDWLLGMWMLANPFPQWLFNLSELAEELSEPSFPGWVRRLDPADLMCSTRLYLSPGISQDSESKTKKERNENAPENGKDAARAKSQTASSVHSTQSTSSLSIRQYTAICGCASPPASTLENYPPLPDVSEEDWISSSDSELDATSSISLDAALTPPASTNNPANLPLPSVLDDSF